MKVLINFADENFKFNQKINALTGKYIGGFNKVIKYGPSDIDNDFYQKNKQILDIKRGAGLWLWKPYFILKTLNTLKEGEFLFYCDAGSFLIRNINPLISEMNQKKLDVFISFVPLQLKNWMRKEVFEALSINHPNYYDGLQTDAAFILLRKSEASVQFIKDWLALCQDYNLIRDANKDEINHPEFIEHRHDQSLLNVVAVQNKLAYYKTISQQGIKPFSDAFLKYTADQKSIKFEGNYPVIVLQNRTRNILIFLFAYVAKLLLFKLSASIYYKIINIKGNL